MLSNPEPLKFQYCSFVIFLFLVNEYILERSILSESLRVCMYFDFCIILKALFLGEKKNYSFEIHLGVLAVHLLFLAHLREKCYVMNLLLLLLHSPKGGLASEAR